MLRLRAIQCFLVAAVAAGMALTMSPATAAIMTSLPLAKAGVGSAMNDTTREVGGALGVAILGSAVSATYSSDLVAHLPAGLSTEAISAAKSSLGGALRVAQDAGSSEIADVARHAFIKGMHVANVSGGIVVLVAAALVMSSTFCCSSVSRLCRLVINVCSDPLVDEAVLAIW